MKEIESRNNETLKFYASLSDKRAREREGLFLAEGAKLVSEGLLRGEADALFFRKGEAEIPRFRAEAARAGVPEDRMFLLSEAAFEKLADAKTPQGVVGAFRIPRRAFPERLCGDFAVLDRIQDPGNLGTLLRTAAATDTRVLLVGCTDPYSPKCVRSSMSGVFAAEFYVCEQAEALAAVQSSGAELCVADMAGENFFEGTYPNAVAIVIGNEAQGVSAFWKERADRTLSLPMENGIESLNAAVCGSAMLMNLKYSRR